MVVRFLLIVGVMFGVVISPVPTYAAEIKKQGLAISPLRQEIKVKSGEKNSGTFSIANYTDQPMAVDLSVRQFSVTDYVYDYKFLTPPTYDWVKLSEPTVILQPGKSKKILYTVEVPQKTTPGGYYFSLFASTKIVGAGLPTTVQAATLLYTVVDGKLVRTSVLQNDSIPFLITGNHIPYRFDVKNTGNVHFSAYFYGQTESLFGKSDEVGTGQILMPGAIKSVQGEIPTPAIPGIYKVNYGYHVDFADFVVTKSAYVVVAPPWSIVLIIFIALGGRWLYQRHIDRRKSVDKS